jgi:hypothetical protein
MPSQLLKPALLAGAALFCVMAVAHFFGIKVPLLFVYYDVPFHAYQDKIIAFSLITYAALFLAAARNREVVPYALFSLGATVLGLASVNASGALASVLTEGQSTGAYWLQTGVFALYFGVLAAGWWGGRQA